MDNSPLVVQPNLKSLIRQDLLHLSPYMPHRNEDATDHAIWIDSNENPYAEEYGRYPDPSQKELREKIGSLKEIGSDHIFISNGSDEAIDLIVRTFCAPKVDAITTLVPGFEAYKHAALLSAVGVREIRQNAPYQYDDELLSSILEHQNKMLFLCSPNNPTGQSISAEMLRKTLEQWAGIVVLDEAYVDFANYESRISWIKEFPKLIVMQTFSKVWGLAGLRVGVTYTHPTIIKALECVKFPYNVSQHSTNMVLNALDSISDLTELIEKWLVEKERLITLLNSHGEVVYIYPSDANFMLVECIDGPALYQFLRSNGVYVRLRKEPECENCLRISVGTPMENDLLIEKINDYEKNNLS